MARIAIILRKEASILLGFPLSKHLMFILFLPVINIQKRPGSMSLLI
jgi:hypothetical protein